MHHDGDGGREACQTALIEPSVRILDGRDLIVRKGPVN